MDGYADLLFYNGEAVTVNNSDDIREALAVKGNRIVFVGSNAEAAGWAGQKTEKIDLQGGSLLPGFIDSHLHLMDMGVNELGVNCGYPAVKSLKDMKETLSAAASVTPPGKWIKGWGYDQNMLSEGRHPDRRDLDEVTTRHPVMVTRICGHIVACNSKALSMAGIGVTTPDPPGGRIERRNGRLTGLFYENAAYDIINRAPYTYEELTEGLKLAGRKLTEMGVTSVHDAGGYGMLQNAVIQDAISKGYIKIRIYSMILCLTDNAAFQEAFLKTGLRTGFGNEFFRLGAFKTAFIDGSSSAPTAAMNEPYCGRASDRGMINITQEELNEICLRAHTAGYQVTAHAVGDRAVEMFLNAIEAAQKAHPAENSRHRIEHCAFVNPRIIARIKALNIIPVSQPVFVNDFGEGYRTDYGDRTDYVFACRSYIDAGIISAGSSDCPVSAANPLSGIHAAVNRKSMKGELTGGRQKINVKEAIRMFTVNGAVASFEEDSKGTLETGKLADLVVLSDSILKCRPQDIRDIKVRMTVINGKTVYRA